jgi:DNA invertase Pin-like site-specific DNA recombinase
VIIKKDPYISINDTKMEKYIAYVRTSTGKQNLGLEEQQTQILDFINKNNSILIDTIVEQESGKNNQRPGLEKALNLCEKNSYILLFTKLDRLSREVEFLFAIHRRGVKLKCIALPELNTLTLGIFGTMAQYERELISQRTKSALQELKKTRKLGSPQNLTEEAKLRGKEVVRRNRIENPNWKMAKTFIEHFKMKNGYIHYTKISQLLNENGYKTRNGCEFSPATVKRLV